MEYGRFFITCIRFSRVGHPFFSKERSVLCVLFRCFKKNGTFFAFFSVLSKRTEQSLRSFLFFLKERNVLCVLFHSFKKNETFFFRSFCLHKSYKHCKSRKKERSVLFKECSVFLKECSVLFSIYICLYISIYIYIYFYIYLEKRKERSPVLLQKNETFSRSFLFF